MRPGSAGLPAFGGRQLNGSRVSSAWKSLLIGRGFLKLNLFMNLVTNDVQSGSLAPALGDDLLAKASAVIVSIQN